MTLTRKLGNATAVLALLAGLSGAACGGSQPVEVDEPENDPRPGIVESPRDEFN